MSCVPELNCTAGPDWPEQFFIPMIIDFAFKALLSKFLLSLFDDRNH